jgi:glycosyltransferase involved in cell wall biosynthesis
VASISDNISISFIVPVLNGERYILSCLDHISREMAPGDEIIVVDNGSTDKTIQIARAYPGVQLLQHPLVSISALRNRGAEQAKGDLFAFIDSDCLVCPGWRKAAVEVLTDERIAATGSIYDFPANPTWVEKAWLSSKNRTARAVEYINSGNFIVKRRAFEAVHGFDELVLTDEDTDIGARLRAQGFGIIDNPEVRAIHLGNAKTIVQFYRKQRWHALGGMKLSQHGRLDKPMVMHMLFLLSVLSALILVYFAVLGTINPIVIPIVCVWVPVVTALYQMVHYGSVKYVLHVMLLYLVFYLARTAALFRAIRIRKRKVASTRESRG